MSPSLSPEILDHIVDHLHDDPTALKACCVTSKSWIHRARKHLFAGVVFSAPGSRIERWKKAFPDPSNSPAHYARSLSICYISIVTARDAGGWIHPFHNLAHLHLESLDWDRSLASLVPFHGLSPTLRSLSLRVTYLEVLDLICSFPLLEDLALFSLRRENNVWNTPLTSPKLTGSLNLRAVDGIRPAVRRLLDLPNGLHFAKIMIVCHDEDVESTMGLVSRCSNTLESLEVSYYAPGAFPPASTSGQ
jgi:hypothetical protein